jgi:lambda family phage portal protein
MGNFLDKLMFWKGKTVSEQDIVGDDIGPRYNQPGGFFGLGGYAGYGGYGGGAYGGSGGDGSKWYQGLSESGSSPILDHQFLRQNARSAYHDSVAAHGVVTRWAQTVVGKGLKLESTPDFETLGISPEQAEEWARKTESAFHSWAKNKKATRSETDNFYQTQSLAEIQKKRDGEFFSRFYRSRRSDLLNPLQLQFVDPSQIRGAAFTDTYGFQANDYDGIERDKSGREIAYHIYQYNKTEKKYEAVTVPAKGAKTGLTQMIHAYQSHYAGQGRGYSDLSHAIQEFEQHTDFTTAHIKQAAIQASISLYVKPSKDEPASNPLELQTHSVAGPRDAVINGTTSTVSETDDLNYHPLPESTFMSPGSVGVWNLGSGEDLKALQNSSPVDSYRDFTEAFVSHLSASMGMPGEVLLMKFGQSYSASRALLVMYWRIVEMEREELATDYLDPTYEAWLEGEIAAGRVKAPGWTNPRLRQAWLKNNWIGDPMPNIDPMRTANADKLYAEMGATTINRIARNLNGSEAKSNMAILSSEYEMLPTPTWNKQQSAAPNTAGGTKNPDDDRGNDDKDDE